MQSTVQEETLPLAQIRNLHHPRCVACDPDRPHGFHLIFDEAPDGWVEATITLDREWEGYSGVCHGGIVATLLDSAMTNCLFAHGVAAVTASMQIRFLHPVPVGEELTVRGHRYNERHQLHDVEAELLRGKKRLAIAKATFMRRV